MSAIPIWLVLAGVAALAVVGVLVVVLVIATRSGKATQPPNPGPYGAAPYAPPAHQQRPPQYGGRHAGFGPSSAPPPDSGWRPHGGDGVSSAGGGFSGGGDSGGTGDGGGGGT